MALMNARMSKSRRPKVGACIVTQNGVCLTGWNGTPQGCDNNCEIELVPNPQKIDDLVTKPDVIHAELNCIMKAAREGVSVMGSTLYVTYSPCHPCAAMIVQSGISRVVFQTQYRDDTGVRYLRDAGIQIAKMADFSVNIEY